MKISSHSESHLVELGDGSHWQIFPGGLDLKMNWTPETEITIAPAEDDLCTCWSLVVEQSEQRMCEPRTIEGIRI